MGFKGPRDVSSFKAHITSEKARQMPTHQEINGGSDLWGLGFRV